MLHLFDFQNPIIFYWGEYYNTHFLFCQYPNEYFFEKWE